MVFCILSKEGKEGYKRAAIIVTSNLVFSQWSGIFANDKVVTTTILDRLLQHSHLINILGDSFRLKVKKDEGIVDSDLYKFKAKDLVKGEEITQGA